MNPYGTLDKHAADHPKALAVRVDFLQARHNEAVLVLLALELGHLCVPAAAEMAVPPVPCTHINAGWQAKA